MQVVFIEFLVECQLERLRVIGWVSTVLRGRHHFFCEMAGGEVLPTFFALKGWLDFAADLLGHRATCVKTTACGNIDGAGEIAGKDDALTVFLNLWVRDGNRRK